MVEMWNSVAKNGFIKWLLLRLWMVYDAWWMRVFAFRFSFMCPLDLDAVQFCVALSGTPANVISFRTHTHNFLFNSFISILLIFTAFQQCFNCVAFVCIFRIAQQQQLKMAALVIVWRILYFFFVRRQYCRIHTRNASNRTPNAT